VRVVGVVLFVVHGIVDIDALVVEELGVGDHGGVLEVLAETPGDEVHVDPGDVGGSEGGGVEPLGVPLNDAE